MIRFVIKTLLLLVWCLAAAFLINLSNEIFAPAERLSAPSFRGIYMGTVVLMMIYVGMINKAYNEIIADKEFKGREAEIIGLGNYLLFAVVPPIIIHRVLLHVGLVIATNGKVGIRDMIFNHAYWQEDFAFLLLPLLLTALFFYYLPQYRLFEEKKIKVFVERERPRAAWREYRLPPMLLEQLREVLEPVVPIEGGKVRLFDIVFIVYENRNYFAILTNGDKCLLPRFEPKMLNRLLLGAWFVKLNNTVRINMLYVSYPIKDKKSLTLDEAVAGVLFAPGSAYSPDLCSGVRHGTHNVKKFLNLIPELEETGWEERLG